MVISCSNLPNGHYYIQVSWTYIFKNLSQKGNNHWWTKVIFDLTYGTIYPKIIVNSHGNKLKYVDRVTFSKILTKGQWTLDDL